MLYLEIVVQYSPRFYQRLAGWSQSLNRLLIFSSSRASRDGIMPDVLHAIGNTPLVRVNKIAKSEGLECELCE